VLLIHDDVALLISRCAEADDRAEEHIGPGQVIHDVEQALADRRGPRALCRLGRVVVVTE